MSDLNRILRHVWCEPKFRAEMEWYRLHPDPIQQIFTQLGSRPVAKTDGAVKEWLTDVADERVEVVLHEPPDWDWWEPRHDHPWRRQDARNRGESA